MDKERELLFAKAVVARGLLTSEQLRQCMAAQFEEQFRGKGAERGEETTGRSESRPLTVIMIERGLLTESQVAELIDAHSHISSTDKTIVAPSSALTKKGPSPVARSRAGVKPGTGATPIPQRQGTPVPHVPGETLPLSDDVPEEVRVAAKNQKNMFGKFVLVNQVGAGGFGAVYRAWQRDLTRWVAIKFLHSEDVDDVQRFVREAQTAAKLTHPGIIAIYEVSVVEKRTYISMEFVDGKPLSRVRMTPKQALVATRDAARAVQYAHDKGVIHRDLKPGNLLIDANFRVCVMDFGLARNVKGGSTLTIEGTVVGTPAFMSPEQAKGDLRATGPLSDVYSLGATLYDLLAGQPPFEGASPYEIVRKVIDQEPTPPRRLAPRVHPEVETIILKALDKDPAKRYATAGNLADDIDRHLNGEPIDAKPVGILTRWWKKIRRNPAVSAAILVAVLGIGGGTTFAIVSLYREARSQEQAAKSANESIQAAKREAKALEEKSKAVELNLEAEKARRESESKRAASEKAAASIARLVSMVERMQVMYYRASFRAEDFDRRLKEVEAQIAQFIKDLPDRPEPHYLLGRIYLESDQIEPAELSLRRALELQPDFSQAHACLARVMFEWVIQQIYFGLTSPEANDHIGKYQAAFEKEYRLAMEGTWAQMPGVDTDKLLLEVLRAIAERKPEKILKVAQEGWEKTHDEEFLRYQAFPYLLMRKYDEAIKVQTQALELRPGWAPVYVERAVLYATKAQHSADLTHAILADRDLKKAIELNPRLPMAHRGMGYKWSALGQFDKSIEEYVEAIRLKPLPICYLEVIHVCKRAKKLDRAMEFAEEMMKRWPEYGLTWNARASLRIEQGDFPGAEADLKKAAEIRPQDTDIQLNLIRLLEKRGNLDGAIAAAATFLAADRDSLEALALHGLMIMRKADALKKAGKVGWRSLMLDAAEDFKAYFRNKPGSYEPYYDECKKAQAEADRLLKSDE